MTTGAKVVVQPLSRPDERAPGSILILSENGKSIAVAFEDGMPLQRDHGMFVHTLKPHAMVLMAMQIEDEGTWTDVVTGEEYWITEEPS